MGQIQFEDEECTAWGLFEKAAMDVKNSNNLHVAEIVIVVDQFGKKSYRLNRSCKAVCGEEIKEHQNQKIPYFDDVSKLRLRLATLQNEGKEVCGRCVAHFYADPEQH